MASVDCGSVCSEQSKSADITSDACDGDLPQVKSSLGFTVYYETSGKKCGLKT
jgi:hypothetical protein